MFQKYLIWRLYAGYVILILFSTAIIGGITSHWIIQENLAEINQILEIRAEFLRELAMPSLSGKQDLELQERISDLGKRIGTRFTIVTLDGRVIADSQEDPESMNNHGERPEIISAREHGKGKSTRFSNTLSTEMMYVALAVIHEKNTIGFVRTSQPLSLIDQHVRHLKKLIVISAVISIFVALILGYFGARNFVKPLMSMTEIAKKMAKGDYSRRLPSSRRDEFGILAKALNQLAGDCAEREGKIESDRSKLSTILEGMSEGVIAVDLEEHVIHINSAACEIIEGSKEDCLSRKLWEVCRIPRVGEMITSTLRSGDHQSGEITLSDQIGDKAIKLEADPIRDGDGNIAGSVIVLHDLSSLKRLETIRRDFVANASHEIKTPITAIRGLVETILDDPELAVEKKHHFLLRIKDQSIRLSTIVSDLLTLSRLETESSESRHEKVELQKLISSSSSAVRADADERGIRLELNVTESPAIVLGDKEALAQLLDNLLNNALKYTNEGGVVKLTLAIEGNHAILEIQDNGIGIEPSHHKRIFERFYRVDKARSRALGGTGLGLSIVRHIALNHNGNVSVKSVPGSGSTFRVELPLCSS